MKEKKYKIESQIIDFDEEMLLEKLNLCAKNKLFIERLDKLCDAPYIVDLAKKI